MVLLPLKVFIIMTSTAGVLVVPFGDTFDDQIYEQRVFAVIFFNTIKNYEGVIGVVLSW